MRNRLIVKLPKVGDRPVVYFRENDACESFEDHKLDNATTTSCLSALCHVIALAKTPNKRLNLKIQCL